MMLEELFQPVEEKIQSMKEELMNTMKPKELKNKKLKNNK